MQRRRDPKYRHHKARNLAVVRIEGKDYYLGRFGTEESKLEYHRLLADWRAALLVPANTNGNAEKIDTQTNNDLSVAELAAKYWEFAEQYYRKDENSRSRVLGSHFGTCARRPDKSKRSTLGQKL